MPLRFNFEPHRHREGPLSDVQRVVMASKGDQAEKCKTCSLGTWKGGRFSVCFDIDILASKIYSAFGLGGEKKSHSCAC